ncbi:hypothetical protein BDQ12DRAFT_694345 [Crucibulum laeve]|uniref:F-box domain-containing protein n=1 Tax=Crucibulum laeve TaxID=68775 RepID=A0A5C3LGM3_9AGAR|nr:hypothetical protein BDQ12DRAFT_694345 [Crucibulum laeve]
MLRKLPLELLSRIIGYLQDIRSLRNVCLVGNGTLLEIARPLAWREVHWKWNGSLLAVGTDDTYQTIVRQFCMDPALIQAVRRLEITIYNDYQTSSDMFCLLLPSQLPSFTNITHIRISVLGVPWRGTDTSITMRKIIESLPYLLSLHIEGCVAVENHFSDMQPLSSVRHLSLWFCNFFALLNLWRKFDNLKTLELRAGDGKRYWLEEKNGEGWGGFNQTTFGIAQSEEDNSFYVAPIDTNEAQDDNGELTEANDPSSYILEAGEDANTADGDDEINDDGDDTENDESDNEAQIEEEDVKSDHFVRLNVQCECMSCDSICSDAGYVSYIFHEGIDLLFLEELVLNVSLSTSGYRRIMGNLTAPLLRKMWVRLQVGSLWEPTEDGMVPILSFTKFPLLEELWLPDNGFDAEKLIACLDLAENFKLTRLYFNTPPQNENSRCLELAKKYAELMPTVNTIGWDNTISITIARDSEKSVLGLMEDAWVCPEWTGYTTHLDWWHR